MEYYIIFINNAFTSLNGDQFKLLYFLAMTMASGEADAMEISIGYLMDVLGKSERSVKKLIRELAEKDFITVDDNMFRLNIDFEAIEETQGADPDAEKPKRVGFV